MELSKICLFCGKVFYKPKQQSKKNWDKRKYHSLRCSSRAKVISDETRNKMLKAVTKSELKTVVCACGCGTEFKKKIFRKGTLNYFRQGRHFLNRDHFKYWFDMNTQKIIAENIT